MSALLERTPQMSYIYFFFNDTATTEIYTLSLHDALPISQAERMKKESLYEFAKAGNLDAVPQLASNSALTELLKRSEEHTSELQSQSNLVCRLLLEKKNQPESCSRDCSSILK